MMAQPMTLANKPWWSRMIGWILVQRAVKPLVRPVEDYLSDVVRKKIRALTGLVPSAECLPEDIFIVGHPRSGNTWVRNLIAGAIYGADPQYAPYTLVSDLIPGDTPYYRRYATPMFFKSHYPPRPDYRRVIYLIRDGRDVMVSYFHYIKAMRGQDVDFLNVVQGDKVLWPYKWHEHVEGWLANPYGADIVTIKYEDLKRDTVHELRRLCEFAGFKRDESFLKLIAEKASFNSMRQKEVLYGMGDPRWPKDTFFVRRGEIGSYKDEMPKAIEEVFMRDAENTLRKLGYLK